MSTQHRVNVAMVNVVLVAPEVLVVLEAAAKHQLHNQRCYVATSAHFSADCRSPPGGLLQAGRGALPPTQAPISHLRGRGLYRFFEAK